MGDWSSDYAHRNDRRYDDEPIVWRPPEDRIAEDGYPRIMPWRTCGYCGSIHPDDLLDLVKTEPTPFVPYTTPEQEFVKQPHLNVADMKYGYPHKIYVETFRVIRPEQEFQMGTNFDKTPIMRKGFRPFVKFYTKHLDSPNVSDEEFLAVTTLIKDLAGILFTREEAKGLMWRCL